MYQINKDGTISIPTEDTTAVVLNKIQGRFRTRNFLCNGVKKRKNKK